jgi:hypothetical protein
MFRSLAVPLLTLLALSACAGAQPEKAPQAAAATPNLPCSLPYGTDVGLVSPRPETAGVRAGNGTFIVVASRVLPSTVSLVATDRRGNASASAPLERIARPEGATSTFVHPIFYRANALGLHAHRHYTIALDDAAQNGCAPLARVNGDARFST